MDGVSTLLTLDVVRVGTRLRDKGVAAISTMLPWLSEERPTPPLMKIDDVVEGVEALALPPPCARARSGPLRRRHGPSRPAKGLGPQPLIPILQRKVPLHCQGSHHLIYPPRLVGLGW